MSGTYIQLMSALAHILSKYIVHRVIKHENILVDASRRLKIGDVSISKSLYTEETQSECGSSLYMWMLAGTYPFMVPKVFDNHYTMKSDIFSMGLVMVVIFELPRQLFPKVNEDFRQCAWLGNFYHHCKFVGIATDALITKKKSLKKENIFSAK